MASATETSPIHTNELIAQQPNQSAPIPSARWIFPANCETLSSKSGEVECDFRAIPNLIEIYVGRCRVIWLGVTHSQKNWRRIFRAFSFWLNWLHCGSPQAAPNVIFFFSSVVTATCSLSLLLSISLFLRLYIHLYVSIWSVWRVSILWHSLSPHIRKWILRALRKCSETCISNHNKVHWKLQLKHLYTQSMHSFYKSTLNVKEINGQHQRRTQTKATIKWWIENFSFDRLVLVVLLLLVPLFI